MIPDYRDFAEWIETYVSASKEVEHGFYDKNGRLTAAGLLCFMLYLLQNGVFSDEHDMAVEYARETGRLMPINDIASLIIYDKDGEQ